MNETTELTTSWKDKKLSNENQELIKELIVKYQQKIINRNNMISITDLNKDIRERREIIGKYIYDMENELYREVLMFFNILCITKIVNTPLYQQNILDNLNIIPYYYHINPTINGRKKKTNKGYNHYINSNKIIVKELMIKYMDMHKEYSKRIDIGVRFL
jgi:competence CoiA-like predicted nuclease